MNSRLQRVSVLIKTFLRDKHLMQTVHDIADTMPEVQMIIVDDGDIAPWKVLLYEDLRARGHEVITLPFDSGFGAKSNAGAAACKRPYLLIGSDDFDFRPASVR